MKAFKYILAITALVAGACSRNADLIEEDVQQLTFTAYQEGYTPSTKTTVYDGGTHVYWEPSDEIKVFFNGSSGRFVSQNTEIAPVTNFSGTIDVVAGANEGYSSSNTFWGLYPYRSDATFDGVSVTTVLPSEQTGRAGSFAQNTHISLSQSSGLDMAFYNVCGGVRFSLIQDGIKSVTFEGNNGETLAGKIKIAFADGVPVIQEVTDPQSVITLTAPEGGTFQAGLWYYISAIPGALSDGFTMKFFRDNESTQLSSSNSVTIKRGIFGSLADADNTIYLIPQENYSDAGISSIFYKGDYYAALVEDDVFDYICVLGSTLSEDDNMTICVNEEGRIMRVVTVNDCYDFYYHIENDNLVDIFHINDNGSYDWIYDVFLSQMSSSKHMTKSDIQTPYVHIKIIMDAINSMMSLSALSLPQLISLSSSYISNEFIAAALGGLGLAATIAFAPEISTAAIIVSAVIFATQITHATIDNCQKIVVDNLLQDLVPTTSPTVKYWGGQETFKAVVQGTTNLDNIEVGIIVGSLSPYLNRHHFDYQISEKYGPSKNEYVFTLSMSTYPGKEYRYKSYIEYTGFDIERKYLNFNFGQVFDFCKYGQVEVFKVPEPYTEMGSVLDVGKDWAKISVIYNNLYYPTGYIIVSNNDDVPRTIQTYVEHEGENVVRIDGLKPGTTYTCTSRVEENDWLYDSENSLEFTTKKDENEGEGGSGSGGGENEGDNENNGIVAVDLGLSVKWASCNVGATKPEGYGDYFAWGETGVNTDYDWSTYKWCNGDDHSLTKYNTMDGWGTVDNLTTLSSEDDAASANWGGSWRMPTAAEWGELMDWCGWNWTDDYNNTGIAGWIVVGNDNSIFLPAAGWQYHGLNDVRISGEYWSSSLHSNQPHIALDLAFTSRQRYGGYYGNARCAGLSVRPVCK